MSKKHKQQAQKAFLQCTLCELVTEIEVVPFQVLPLRTRLDCGCEEYSARFVHPDTGFDLMVQGRIEGRSAA